MAALAVRLLVLADLRVAAIELRLLLAEAGDSDILGSGGPAVTDLHLMFHYGRPAIRQFVCTVLFELYVKLVHLFGLLLELCSELGYEDILAVIRLYQWLGR